MYSRVLICLLFFVLLNNCNSGPNISELAKQQALDSVLVRLKSSYSSFDNIEILEREDSRNTLLIEDSFRLTCCRSAPCNPGIMSDEEVEIMAQDMMLSMGTNPDIQMFDAVIFHFTDNTITTKTYVVKIPVKKLL